MIAIIPARGGSKGLPGKNIKPLNGKPMIAYTIEAALNSKGISRVIVSTDDEEIAKVAKEYGAEVPFMRPAHLATDEAKSIDVFKFTISELEKKSHQIPHFMVLQPTSPLRDSKDIDEAIALFNTKKAENVISFCEEDHPIFWHKYITKEGKFEEIFEGDFIKNRQEIKKTYRPNGAIYIFSKKTLETQNYYSENTFAYIMDKKNSIDVDTIDDFEYAEFLLKKRNDRL